MLVIINQYLYPLLDCFIYHMSFLKNNNNEKIYISSQGLKKILEKPNDPQYPFKGVAWTDDFRW